MERPNVKMSMATLSETLTHQGQLGQLRTIHPQGSGVIMPQVSMVTAVVWESGGLVVW
jgi:hypothetical protein